MGNGSAVMGMAQRWNDEQSQKEIKYEEALVN
jgi:hypothetical protein